MLLYNTLLKHYSRGSSPEDSLLLYNHLRRLSAHPLPDQSFTLSVLLKSCANSSRPCFGTQLHCHSIKVGFGSHVYVQTALLNMYVECGSFSNAVKVFDFMSVKNVVTWNAFLTGAAKCGRLELARDLFDAMPVKNVVSWTGLIDGYTRAGRALEAVGFLRRMMGEGVRPSEITVLAIIPAISNLGMLCLGESVHAYGEKNGHACLMSV
ncbi:Pentatricopeptide repeat-containing protein [Acorus calamus]|uniref:Pentatricopeptide repeat-containing protein n=1 Tax=Acorus calamus TaxID=4465 RepID=A0AAV9EH08_ACOCL|nr:Pentatricopeptide repeat-containing protein [Acorus calamus]